MRERELQDFGPYRIVRQLAVGGMAEIYLARPRGLEGIERTVVLKRILERYAHDGEFVTMFLDEARLLAALTHPNIAQVFDVGQVDHTYYLVMEHVRGPTLGRLLGAAREHGGLPRRVALGIGLGIAEALHYVHERKDELGRPLDIVRRDLNPANVMVSYDGAVKLIDFGIAKAATKVYETRTGVVKGTYGYIAPEQLAGETPVDRRADVFALGILLYEMCVGVHPFDVSDEPSLIDRILQARYRRPREVRPDFPAALDALIASCLDPDPAGRPSDVASVIEELAAHLGALGMVPTQHGLAAVTQALIPDGEGPRPLKRLTSPRRIPFRDAPDTRKVRVRDTDETTAPTHAPKIDPWTVPTVRFEDEAQLTLEQEDATVVSDREHDHDDEPPTTLIAMPSDRPPPPRDEATWVPTPKRSPSLPRWLGLALGLAGLLASGLAAFFVARAFSADATTPTAIEPVARTSAAAPAAVTLRVVSDPPGARVSVDGEPAEGVTPLVLTIPAERGHVWLRLAKTGHLDQEREVSATVGEARFVLPPLAGRPRLTA